MSKKHLSIATLVVVFLLGAACSSDSSDDDSGDASTDGTESAAGDDGAADDGDSDSLDDEWVLAEVTAGVETFEVRAICAVNGDRITLTTDSVDNSVAVEEPGGTIVVRVADGEDPTDASIWSVTGADVTVEAGRLVTIGTAESPLVAGAVVAEPAEVTVEADCPDA